MRCAWLTRRSSAHEACPGGQTASSWLTSKGRLLLGLRMAARKPLQSVLSTRKQGPCQQQNAAHSVLLGIAFVDARSASPGVFVPQNPATEWVDDPHVHTQQHPAQDENEEEEAPRTHCLCCRGSSGMVNCMVESAEWVGAMALVGLTTCLHAAADAG